jgi:AmiR/NasT family two-component response regulator
MGSIIIAFPAGTQKTASRIRDLLGRAGYRDVKWIPTGSEVLQEAERRDGGIVITAVALGDMHYTELLDYLPENFELLLLDSAVNISSIRAAGVIAVTMPVKVHEFLETVAMMLEAVDRRLQKAARKTKHARSEQDDNCINNAKAVLMERNHMTEEEAYRYIQKTSMDTGRSMVETAQMVLTMAIM